MVAYQSLNLFVQVRILVGQQQNPFASICIGVFVFFSKNTGQNLFNPFQSAKVDRKNKMLLLLHQLKNPIL